MHLPMNAHITHRIFKPHIPRTTELTKFPATTIPIITGNDRNLHTTAIARRPAVRPNQKTELRAVASPFSKGIRLFSVANVNTKLLFTSSPPTKIIKNTNKSIINMVENTLLLDAHESKESMLRKDFMEVISI